MWLPYVNLWKFVVPVRFNEQYYTRLKCSKNLKQQELFTILKKHILTKMCSSGPLFTLKICSLQKQHIIVKSVLLNGTLAALY